MGMKEVAEKIRSWRPTFNAKGKPLNDLGQEMPDPLPLEPPVGYQPRESLTEQIRRMVRSERLAVLAEEDGRETFEESDDFDIPDDPVDPSTPYEADFDRGEVRELKRLRDLDMAQERAAAAAAEAADASSPPARPKGRSPAKKPPAPAGDVSGAVLDDGEGSA